MHPRSSFSAEHGPARLFTSVIMEVDKSFNHHTRPAFVPPTWSPADPHPQLSPSRSAFSRAVPSSACLEPCSHAQLDAAAQVRTGGDSNCSAARPAHAPPPTVACRRRAWPSAASSCADGTAGALPSSPQARGPRGSASFAAAARESRHAALCRFDDGQGLTERAHEKRAGALDRLSVAVSLALLRAASDAAAVAL